MEYRISGRWERWPDAEDSGPQRSTTPVIARLREMAQLRGRGACEFGTLWLHGHAPDKPRPEPMLFRGFHLFFARTAAGEAVAITPTLPMALRDLSAHPLAPRVTEQAQQGMAAFGAGDTRGGRLAFTHATELAEGLGDAGIDLLVHALLSFAVGLNDV